MEEWIFRVTAVALPAILAITLHEAALSRGGWATTPRISLGASPSTHCATSTHSARCCCPP